MVGCNVIAAETDADARRLASSLQQAFTRMLRNARGQLPPPIDDIETFWTPAEKAQASRMLRCTFIGAKDTVLVWPGESVRVSIDFACAFPGPQDYLLHCHNLEHEDGGMMLKVRVV